MLRCNGIDVQRARQQSGTEPLRRRTQHAVLLGSLKFHALMLDSVDARPAKQEAHQELLRGHRVIRPMTRYLVIVLREDRVFDVVFRNHSENRWLVLVAVMYESVFHIWAIMRMAWLALFAPYFAG